MSTNSHCSLMSPMIAKMKNMSHHSSCFLAGRIPIRERAHGFSILTTPPHAYRSQGRKRKIEFCCWSNHLWDHCKDIEHWISSLFLSVCGKSRIEELIGLTFRICRCSEIAWLRMAVWNTEHISDPFSKSIEGSNCVSRGRTRTETECLTMISSFHVLSRSVWPTR